MKIRLSRQNGNVVIFTFSLSLALVYILTAYLQLVRQQNRLSVRSQSWNLAIAVAEAGIEEALTQINYTSQLANNQWTPSADGSYTKTRDLGSNHFSATIIPSFAPVLQAQGSVQLPDGQNYVSRKVQVITVRNSLFNKAMVAKGEINMNGNNIRTDSFDSTDPLYNTNGGYDSTKVKSNGDVATNSGLTNSLNVGNANIWGRVATGPGGSISIGPNGSVGDVNWQTSGSSGIMPGWSTDDMNVLFPEVRFTNNGASYNPGGGKVDGDNVSYILDKNYGPNDYWVIASLKGSLVVRSNVNAVLLVTDTINLSGQDYIKIQPGGTLRLFMQGTSATIAGKGVINQNSYATNFFYLGLTNNTSLDLSGNGQFTGIIYAPTAAFTLRGGGNSYIDFVGTSVTSTVTFAGHYHFHYDESLANLYGDRGFIIRSWREI